MVLILGGDFGCVPTAHRSERIAVVTFKTDPGTHVALRGEKWNRLTRFMVVPFIGALRL